MLINDSNLSPLSLMNEIGQDLETYKNQLTGSQSSRADKTIKELGKILQNKDQIAKLSTDDLKNKAINKLTGGGAEDGFSEGTMVKERIDFFIQTYLKAKEKGDLKGFFSCFSKGDACLSGRMESLYQYAASLEGLNIQEMPDPEKSFFLPASVFSEIMMTEFDGDESLSVKTFKDYIKEHEEEIAQEFKTYENKEPARAFLECLKITKVYEKEEVDWKEIIQALTKATLFEAVYNQSLKYVI